jgi:hypothetical protein
MALKRSDGRFPESRYQSADLISERRTALGTGLYQGSKHSSAPSRG